MNEKRLLLASPQMRGMAERICSANADITLGAVSWDRFPDTFPNTFVHQVDDAQRAHVSFLACFDRPEVIFEQISLIYALAALAPLSFRVLLPYFPTGTMERVDQEGQIPTAGTLAQMLSAVAPAGPGPVPLYMWDIHALPIRSFFGLNIAPRFKTGTKLLKERLGDERVVVAFPDDGARKRFTVMFRDAKGSKYSFIVCRKLRKGTERIVSVIDGDPSDQHVVIVDDLAHSGGTLIECMHALKNAGAAQVSAYITHGVFEDGAWKKFVDAGFHKVWITDSCPATVDLVRGIEPFEVLSIQQSITNAIRA